MDDTLIRRSDAVAIIKAAKADLVHDYAYAAADFPAPYIQRMELLPPPWGTPRMPNCHNCPHWAHQESGGAGHKKRGPKPP